MALPLAEPHTHDAENAEPIEVKTAVSDAGTWTKKLDITVPAAEVGKVFDKVVREVAQHLKIPGFRPGKVPLAYAEKRFGKEIHQQVKSDVVSRAFRSALEAEKLDVVGSPDLDPTKIEVVRGKETKIEIEVEVKPTFELPTFKGLKVEQEEVELFPGEIDEKLKAVAERFAEDGEAPEGATLQDRDIAAGKVTFEVDGKVVHTEDDGNLLLVDGHTVGCYAHLGQKWLLGAKAGEERSVETTLDERFPVESARNQKAKIAIAITKIRRPQIPAIDDELAKKVGMENLDGLKARIEEELRKSLSENAEAKVRNSLVEQVVEGAKFELPKRLVETFSKSLMQRQDMMLAQYGLDPSAMKDEDGKRSEEAAKNAEEEIRRYFVLDAICAAEKLEVGEEEIDEEIVKQARQRGMRAAELFERLEQEGGIEQLRSDLKAKRAVDLLVDNAEVKIVPRKKEEPKAEAGCGHDHDHEDGHGHDEGEKEKKKPKAKKDAKAEDEGKEKA